MLETALPGSYSLVSHPSACSESSEHESHRSFKTLRASAVTVPIIVVADDSSHADALRAATEGRGTVAQAAPPDDCRLVVSPTLSTEIGGHRYEHATCSAAGRDHSGNTKENQDTLLVLDSTTRAAQQQVSKAQGASVAPGRPLPSSLLLGVFDGHGTDGRLVSQAVATFLPRILALCPHFKAQAYEQSLRNAFPICNELLLRRSASINCTLSGSTGCVALVVPDGRLVVANLGDSRCVIGRVDGFGNVSAVNLTTDHTPELPAEAQRIVANGGRIASYQWHGQPMGPPRVWMKGSNLPGLCMTRCFGDTVAASVGVTCQPDITTHVLQPGDRYVLMLSDGIFEFMSTQRAVEIVHAAATERGLTPDAAAAELVREARRVWGDNEHNVVDDCSVTVAFVSDPALLPAPAVDPAMVASQVPIRVSSARRGFGCGLLACMPGMCGRSVGNDE